MGYLTEPKGVQEDLELGFLCLLSPFFILPPCIAALPLLQATWEKMAAPLFLSVHTVDPVILHHYLTFP